MEIKSEQLEKAMERWQQLQPLNQYDREKFSRRFSVDFNYNSNHIEGNTLTYGQTELLLLFGRVVQEAEMRDLEEMKASDVGLKMMTEEATMSVHPLTETFIRQLHKTLLREDYEVYRNLPGGVTTSYTIHAGQYKRQPNLPMILHTVITFRLMRVCNQASSISMLPSSQVTFALRTSKESSARVIN